MIRSRSVRTKPRNGLAIGDLLAAVLLSELCAPSAELWLVSGWLTDIPVLNNQTGQYDALVGEQRRSHLLLTDVLATIADRGAELHVAIRQVDHNERFAQRIIDRVDRGKVSVYRGADLHEKFLVGDDWLMKGSMNFTWNGVQVNEEHIDLEVGRQNAAQQRLELRTRWIEVE